MTKLNQVYKCNVCGNIVEMVHTGIGQLVCCGEPMQLMEEKDKEEGTEKHLPVVEKIDNNIKIKVGSVEHPMTTEHYIEWIEIIFNGKVGKKFLHPNEKPEVEFEFKNIPENFEIRAYCNVHGLWKAGIDNKD